MPKILLSAEQMTCGLAVRIPKRWLPQIERLQKLQGVSRSEQLRELIKVGAEQVGLDLD